MATKRQVEAKLRELIGRLEDAGGSAQGQLAKALPNARVIQIEVPDLDARYWIELAHGRLGTLRTGASDGWDIRVTADADDLIAMIDGGRNLLTSYLIGRVRVQASATDLMALRKLM